MLRCNDISAELDAYLDGELEETRAGEIAAHIEGCRLCRELLDERRSIALAVRRLPAVKAPEGFAAKFSAARQAAPAGAATPRGRRRRRFGWAAGSVAAAAAAVLMAATLLPKDRPAKLSAAGDEAEINAAPDSQAALAKKAEGSAEACRAKSKSSPKNLSDEKGRKTAGADAGGRTSTEASPLVKSVKKADRIMPPPTKVSAPAKTPVERQDKVTKSLGSGKSNNKLSSDPGYSKHSSRAPTVSHPKPAPEKDLRGVAGGVTRPGAVQAMPPPPAADPKRKAREQQAYVLDVEVLRGSAVLQKGKPGGASRRLALRAGSAAAAESRLLAIARTLGGGRLGVDRASSDPAKDKQGLKGAAPAGAIRTNLARNAMTQPATPEGAARGKGSGPGTAPVWGGTKSVEKLVAGKKQSGRTLVLYVPSDQAETFARAFSLLSRTDVKEVKRFGARGAKSRSEEVRKLVSQKAAQEVLKSDSSTSKPGKQQGATYVLFVIELTEGQEAK